VRGFVFDTNADSYAHADAYSDTDCYSDTRDWRAGLFRSWRDSAN